MSVDVKNSPSMQQILRVQDQIASGWIKGRSISGHKRCLGAAMSKFLGLNLEEILYEDVVYPYLHNVVYPYLHNASAIYFNDAPETTHADVLNLVDVMVDYTEQLVEEGVLD